MIYCCFDQASSITGYSIYKNTKLIDYGVVTAEGNTNIRMYTMTKLIVDKILEIQKKHKNEKFKINLENIQFQEKVFKNIVTFKTLAKLQGMIEYAVMSELKLEVEYVYSSEWKSTSNVKGKNRAQQKASAQEIVKKELNIDVTEDEADAILLGKHCSHKEINW